MKNEKWKIENEELEINDLYAIANRNLHRNWRIFILERVRNVSVSRIKRPTAGAFMRETL